ncbi:MAG: DUF6438 domain-containing protein [Saprospiraceae bacterium]
MSYQIKCFSKSSSFLLSLGLFFMTQSFFSCATNQKKLQKLTNSQVIVTYEKERTRGLKNPLFKMELQENQIVKYTGLANVPVIGERKITIDRTTYAAILEQFQSTDFAAFDTVYKERLRDLPLTSITFKAHKVTYQEVACPKSPNKLAKLMEDLIPST